MVLSGQSGQPAALLPSGYQIVLSEFTVTPRYANRVGEGPMHWAVRIPLRLMLSIIVLLVTLILEIFLSMFTYMYLALVHLTFFGELVRYARHALNGMVDLMESLAPGLSTQAHATLVGELGPKSFLLLFIGLFASGLIRVIVWGWRKAMVRVPSTGKASPKPS
ncbi:hypothetical protein MnTg02_01555 [bacterium MnTg02]|nr:hypothetical protein MnTg02_01555 [bacterium MnTg02]